MLLSSCYLVLTFYLHRGMLLSSCCMLLSSCCMLLSSCYLVLTFYLHRGKIGNVVYKVNLPYDVQFFYNNGTFFRASRFLKF